jgi:O-antigen ligase
MKSIMRFCIEQTPSAICMGGAVALAMGCASGWGWFLFVGVLVAVHHSDD